MIDACVYGCLVVASHRLPEIIDIARAVRRRKHCQNRARHGRNGRARNDAARKCLAVEGVNDRAERREVAVPFGFRRDGTEPAEALPLTHQVDGGEEEGPVAHQRASDTASELVTSERLFLAILKVVATVERT